MDDSLRSDYDLVRRLTGTIEADNHPDYYFATDRLFKYLDDLFYPPAKEVERYPAGFHKHKLKFTCVTIDKNPRTQRTDAFYIWECPSCIEMEKDEYTWSVEERAWHLIRKGILPTEEDLA